MAAVGSGRLGWHVEPAFDFQQALLDRRKAAAERALIAFEFGDALVVTPGRIRRTL